MNNFERFAWLVFNTEENAESCMTALEALVISAPQDSQAQDFKISPIKNNQTAKLPKVTPDMPLDHV